jgi:hypothetical protein
MLALLILSLLSLFSVITAQNQGTILSPAAGAKIKPKQNFSFAYKVHQDYCVSENDYPGRTKTEESGCQVSSQNITVALLTQPPTSTSNTGHYFGRFATGNYPSQGK